jgi:multimeric flavodoxin WrbA
MDNPDSTLGGQKLHNILGIVGSPRKSGNTELLVERVLDAARREGAATSLFALAGRKIEPCLACDECVGGPPEFCVQDDDMKELYPLMVWADAIVFGTPVYMGTMTAQLKAVFDRARPLWLMDNALSRKVAAAIAVGEGRWGGQELAIQQVYWAALNHGMIVVGGACLPYGNWEVCGVAGEPGAILNDADALSAADGLGRRLARLKISA